MGCDVRRLAAAYDGLLNALAVISGVLLGIMAFVVIADVLIRNIGLRPPPHTSAFVEYSLLYVTLLASPWLLREKGHVYIEVLLAYLGREARRGCAIITYALCLATCATLFYYSLDLTWLSWKRGDIDIRSFDMPRWMLLASMPVSFLLMGIEFARYLLGYDSLYSRHPPAH
jgi:TRAP-type C4-dicarboxylate transport system permease small subunit